MSGKYKIVRGYFRGLQVREGAMERNFVVICRADNGDEWEMVAATRRLFTADQAARYAATVAVSRSPRVLSAAEYLAAIGWRKARED